MTTMRLLDNVFSVRTDESDHPQNLGELNCLQCLIYGRSAEELLQSFTELTKVPAASKEPQLSCVCPPSRFTTFFLMLLHCFSNFVNKLEDCLLKEFELHC